MKREVNMDAVQYSEWHLHYLQINAGKEDGGNEIKRKAGDESRPSTDLLYKAKSKEKENFQVSTLVD